MDDFVTTTVRRIASGELEVLGKAEIDSDNVVFVFTREDGSELTRDERYAVSLGIFKGRLKLHHSYKSLYEVRYEVR